MRIFTKLRVLASALSLACSAMAQAAVAMPDVDNLYWHSVMLTNSPDEYRAYLDAFPNGHFAALARARTRRLSSPETQGPSVGEIISAAWKQNATWQITAMISASDVVRGEECSLGVGDLVRFSRESSKDSATAEMKIVTSRPADCRAGGIVQANITDLRPMLGDLKLRRDGENGLRLTDPSESELLFWQSIANSTDPTDYKAYLETYPDGLFAGLAKIRLNASNRQRKDQPAAEKGDSPEPKSVAASPTRQRRQAPAEPSTPVEPFAGNLEDEINASTGSGAEQRMTVRWACEVDDGLAWISSIIFTPDRSGISGSFTETRRQVVGNEFIVKGTGTFLIGESKDGGRDRAITLVRGEPEANAALPPPYLTQVSLAKSNWDANSRVDARWKLIQDGSRWKPWRAVQKSVDCKEINF